MLGVMVFNTSSLQEKIKVEDFPETETFKLLEEELGSESEVLSGILKSPDVSGVDFQKNMYSTLANSLEEDSYGGVSMMFLGNLSDAKQFENTLKNIAKEQGEQCEVISTNGVSIWQIDDQLSLAWDEKRFAFLANERENEFGSEWLASCFVLPQKEQLIGQNNFASFMKESADIAWWLAMDVLYDKFSKGGMMLNGYAGLMNRFKCLYDTQVGMRINFLADGIEMNVISYLGKEAEELYERVYANIGDFNKSLLRMLPAQTFMVMAGGFDVLEQINMFKEVDMYKQMDGLAITFMGLSIEDLLTTLGGSMLMQIHDIKEKTVIRSGYHFNGEEYEIQEVEETILFPQMSFLLDLKTDTAFHRLINAIPEGVLEKHGNYNSLSLSHLAKGLDEHIYWSVKEDALLLTTDKSVVDHFIAGKPFANSLNDHELKSKICDNLFFAYWDLRYQKYPSYVKNLIEDRGLEGILGLLRYWESKSESYDKGEFILRTKDTETNILHYIIQELDKFIQMEE